MNTKLGFGIWLFILLSFNSIVAQNSDVNPNTLNESFENVEQNKLPTGWMFDETNQSSSLTTWSVANDSTTPSGNKVLAVSSQNNNSGSTFNLCWTNNISFLNGEIKVLFKAKTGEEDQGGGIMWRVKDKGNYYVARFNPLEDNFRIYYIKNEYRKMIATATVKLPLDKWNEMKITQIGNHISGFLNGKLFVEVDTDIFNNAGGVGLWTKADAVTSFDDFAVIIKDLAQGK